MKKVEWIEKGTKYYFLWDDEKKKVIDVKEVIESVPSERISINEYLDSLEEEDK